MKYRFEIVSKVDDDTGEVYSYINEKCHICAIMTFYRRDHYKGHELISVKKLFKLERL